MQKALLVFAVLFFFSCNSSDLKPADVAAPVVFTGTSGNSAAFNATFKKALQDYYELKEQFIAENRGGIDTAASQLKYSVNEILTDSLSGDSTIRMVAKTYITGIDAELIGLKGEQDLEEKRKAFQMVGEQFYDLIRTVQYDQEVIYHVYCSGVFSDEGASWLSSSAQIRNPYRPKTMPDCGEVRDSIDLRIKAK
ncbi:MAG: DUF3347 domain-containing protein [Sediminibacterium sp.]|nr:DUF3347 domain-containing protein [Sediminibacterium sp.]